MLEFLRKFEKATVIALTVLMIAVVFLSVLELAWVLVKDVITPPVLILEVAELLDIFGLFLLVLIGIELLETMKAYLVEGVIHIEVVLTVAIIAIARKIIVLDTADYTGLALIGIAVIIIALAAAYYLVKRLRVGSKQPGRDTLGS